MSTPSVSHLPCAYPATDPRLQPAGGAPPDALQPGQDNPELRAAFQDFVGQTFYQQMLAAMRRTVDKPAYFHGGRAEEIFQGQLDQVLSEELTKASADSFAGPMYDLFALPRL